MKRKFGRVYVPDEQWIPVMALMQGILNTDLDPTQAEILIVSRECDKEMVEKIFGDKP